MKSLNQSVINPAGFWIRFLATTLDRIIIILPTGLIVYFLIFSKYVDDFYLGVLISMSAIVENEFIFQIVLSIYAFISPLVWYGYTVGKRIVGVRIVKMNGEKLSLGTMLLRVIVAAIIYVVTLGIAAIVSAFMVGIREDKRSIHDLISGTYVTYEKPER